MASTSAKVHTLPFPLLPPELQRYEKFKTAYDEAVKCFDDRLNDAQSWQPQNPGREYLDWVYHRTALSRRLRKAVDSLREATESTDDIGFGAFNSAWERIYNMAEAELSVIELKVKQEYHAHSSSLSRNTMETSSNKFVDTYNSAREHVKKAFATNYDTFIVKASIDKDIVNEIEPLIMKLVFGISLRKKDLRSALQEQVLQSESELPSALAEVKVQEIIKNELTHIDSSTDLGTASIDNEERPSLPLVGLLNDCKWHRATWEGLLSVRERHEQASKERPTMELSYRSIFFKEATGDADKKDLKSMRKELKEASTVISASGGSGGRKRKASEELKQ